MRTLVYDQEETLRVDAYVSDVLTDVSRSEIQRLLQSGDILVNDKKVKSSYKLIIDDVITINEIVEEEFEVTPVDYPLDVIYEDEHMIVINKPAGIVVYPGAGKEKVSVVAALLGMNVDLYESEEKDRIGVVHRLDKDTSGLLVLSKTELAHNYLLKLFKERDITRKYRALVRGNVLHDFGTIDAPIGRDERNRTKMAVVSSGRESKTYFSVIKRFKDFTFVDCELYSGRTHQIRVHMRYIKHPVIGDPIYGKSKEFGLDNLMLQSYYLKFKHPTTGDDVEIELEIREDFSKFMSEWSL